MDNLEAAKRMLLLMEAAQMVPRSFFSAQLPLVFNFMSGITTALSVTDIYDLYRKTYNTVTKDFGWEVLAHHPIHQMALKGLSEEEINKQALELEIETFKRMIEELSSLSS